MCGTLKRLFWFSPFFLSRNFEESHYHASICCPLRINYKWLSVNKLVKIYGRPTTSHFQIPVWIRINLAPCGEETLSFNQTFYLLIKLWLSSKQILANLVLCKCLNELIKNRRFLISSFKILVRWFGLLRKSNWIKLDILKSFKPKLGKLLCKIKLKLCKINFTWSRYVLEFKVLSSMKLEFNEMWARSSTSRY